MIEEAGGERAGLSRDFLIEVAKEDAQKAYDAREEEFAPERMRELERRVVLAVLDRKWREHLYEMDYLREGIGLRAMAQRDPLIEYQREGYDLFNTMMEGIKEDSVGHLFNIQPEFQQNPIVEDAEDADAALLPGMRQALPTAPAACRRSRGRRRARQRRPARQACGKRPRRAGRPCPRRAGRCPGRRPARRCSARWSRRARDRRARAQPPAAACPAFLQRAERGRRRPGRAAHRIGRRRQVREGRAQLPVPLWLGPQVQALPRRPAQPR